MQQSKESSFTQNWKILPKMVATPQLDGIRDGDLISEKATELWSVKFYLLIPR